MTRSSQMNRLRITKEQFDKLYPGLDYDHFNEPPPKGITKEEFERRYLTSKLWRLNNIYTIVNKQGEAETFRMNLAQHKVYAASKQHPRLIILKSRQQGISTLWLCSYFDDAVFGRNLTIGLMAQGTDEASTLLERVKFLWDNLSPDIKNFAGVKLERDNTKEFGLSNNCTMLIRVSFRSATLQRLHISEFGKIANANPQRAKETKTGTLQALGRGTTGVIESTAEGNNEFKRMWDAAIVAECSGQMTHKDFKPVFLSWLDDPDCALDIYQVPDKEAEEYFESLGVETTVEQRNFWIAQRRELMEDIGQEYPATPEEAFAATHDGTYYARKFNHDCVRAGGLIKDLYDENLNTSVYFDLGVDDYFVMVWVQWYRGKYKLVKEYWNNGYGLEFYLDTIIEQGWPISELVFPHDIRARELGTRRARTRYDMVCEYIKNTPLAKANVKVLAKSSVADGIAAVRRILPNLQIDPSCTYIIGCLNNYSKERDYKLNVWKPTPIHDEWSHGADVVRSIAVDHAEKGKSNMAIPTRSIARNSYAV